jgi:3-oxoacyl-[acyl-carrier protein] reductase
MSLTAHRALVTGGTEAIGRAVVRRLAREGHSVIAIHRSDDATREEVGREFADAHLEVGFERVDLAKSTQVADLFERLAEMGRSPELLVNAGGLDDAHSAFLDAVDLDAVLDLSLRATFLTCQQAVKAMVRHRFGRIINFVSPAALQGGEGGQTADAAARAGVLGLTRALAREVGPLGITVNAVCAGAIRTERITQASGQQLEALVRRTPLRRAGTADEVAGMVNMLCEDGAGYITGQCLSIDGGLS